MTTPSRRFGAARVLLRGGVPASVLDHVIAPRHRGWNGSTRSRRGIDRVATPAVRERGLTVTNARGRLQPADRRVRGDDVAWPSPAVCPSCWSSSANGPGSRCAGVSCRSSPSGSSATAASARDVRCCWHRSARILATRRHPERGAASAERRALRLRPLDEVLRASDLVVVAAPLTDETAGLIGADQLAQMRESAWLINIARGRLIDELALRRALSRAGSAAPSWTSLPRSHCPRTRPCTTRRT